MAEWGSEERTHPLAPPCGAELKGPPGAPGRRSVSLPTRCAALFGASSAQLGWGVVLLGAILLWTIGPACDWRPLQPWRGPEATAAGTVLSSEKTGFAERSKGGKKAGKKVYTVRYRFEVEGRTWKGTSYSVGYAPRDGDAGEVDYDAADPSTSRLRGMRRRPLGEGPGILTLVLILVGACILLPATLRGLRAVHLLSRGVLVRGRLLSAEPTGLAYSRMPVLRYRYAYEVKGTSYTAEVRTHRGKGLLDDAEERILHDPDRPGRSLLVDSVPLGVTLEADTATCDRPRDAILRLVLPGLAVFGLLALAFRT